MKIVNKFIIISLRWIVLDYPQATDLLEVALPLHGIFHQKIWWKVPWHPLMKMTIQFKLNSYNLEVYVHVIEAVENKLQLAPFAIKEP